MQDLILRNRARDGSGEDGAHFADEEQRASEKDNGFGRGEAS
jgi:hypothetical protein